MAKPIEPNLLERAVALVSPRTALSMVMWRWEWRDFMERNYDAAKNDRLTQGWVATNSNAEMADAPYRSKLRARARDLERNSDTTEAIIGALKRNVVGTGMMLQARTRKSDKSDNEDLNEQIEELWEDWCRKQVCDVSGQQDFSELQEMAVRRFVVDGEILFIKSYNGSWDIPLQLQAREADELDSAIYEYQGNKVYGGIEIDSLRKPVAYHFINATLDGYNYETVRIPAERVIHLFVKEFPTQVHGVTHLARSMVRIRDLDGYLEAEAVKARIAACLGVFIRSNSSNTNFTGRNAKDDPKVGQKQLTLAPGMISKLLPGEDITVVNPSGVSTTLADFTRTSQRLAGGGQGLSYEAVSRDYSQTNYSSARQGLLEDQKTYQAYQQFLIKHFCKEIYTEFVISAFLAGKITAPDFWKNKRNYLRHEWITPGWDWIDPQKEINAANSAIDNGLDTRARVLAAKGRDWREEMRQIAREQAYAKELGINLTGGAKNDTASTTGDGETVAGNGDGTNQGG